MPSIVPSYVYTLFASMIVGALLIYSFNVSTTSIKAEAEQQRLGNLAKYVAVKCIELLSSTTIENLSTTLGLDIPSSVGNQRYWIQLQNDSSVAWVEIGYGTTPFPTDQRVLIPAKAYNSGEYVSGSGIAILECHSNSSGIYLRIAGGT